MESSKMPHLSALAVFKNILNEELIRSFHVYQMENGKEFGVEREFLFSPSSYVEMAAQPLLKLSRVQVSEMLQGQVIGIWLCMLAFDINHGPSSAPIPSILEISRNPKLRLIPTLACDLEKVYKLRYGSESEESSESADNEFHIDKNHGYHCPTSVLPLVFDQDLNCLPYTDDTPMSSDSQQDDQCVPGNVEGKKKKRAATEVIAKISLEDLIKHFDLPIAEASKNLNVGLTVLKKKCRELGIPRWPHRKIKSLDTLIHNLQEEAQVQERENKAAAMAVMKRQRMLKSEKESIERKPFMEIHSETKRFRQDVFKRRHRARVLSSKAIVPHCPPTKGT